MRKRRTVAGALALTIVVASGTLASSTSALAHGPEQVEDTALLASTWSRFSQALPSGTPVRVALKGGRTLDGSLFAASESTIVLRTGRRWEPDITIKAQDVDSVRRHGGNTQGLTLMPGERVRVVTRDSRAPRVGTLTSFDPESLSLLVEGQPGVVRIERSSLDSLQISGGPKPLGSRIKKGALLGLAAGMACGLAYSLIASPCWGDPGQCEQGALHPILFGAVFSVIAVPVGIGIGAAVPGERWKKMDRSQLALAFVPQKRGVGLALRLRF